VALAHIVISRMNEHVFISQQMPCDMLQKTNRIKKSREEMGDGGLPPPNKWWVAAFFMRKTKHHWRKHDRLQQPIARAISSKGTVRTTKQVSLTATKQIKQSEIEKSPEPKNYKKSDAILLLRMLTSKHI